MVESRREANKRKCRQKILKASRRLFKEKGYENTMIEDVANKAEVSKATLYNYFPNKESLLVGTMDDVTESFNELINKLGDSMNADEKIRAALKFVILDTVPFVSVSRRILFLNGCKESHMFGKANAIKSVLHDLVKEAQKTDIYVSDIATKDIVDQLMGVYLISQFQWVDLETMTEEECVARIDRVIDLALAGCYTENRTEK